MSETQIQTFSRAEVGCWNMGSKMRVVSLGCCWLKHSCAPQLIDSCAVAVASGRRVAQRSLV